jgi:hypothetical protein
MSAGSSYSSVDEALPYPVEVAVCWEISAQHTVEQRECWGFIHLMRVFSSPQICILFIDIIVQMEVSVICETKSLQYYGVIAIYKT